MAGNIKGIIVEIGGDTSGLQKALSKVNSATSSLSKELRGINSLLKLDPKNTELLAQKQTVLNQNIEQTSDKLKQLQTLKADADKKMAEGTEINEENYRALQREIINTENKLKSLQLENSKWTQAGKKIEDFGTKIGNLSSKLDNIGNKLTAKLTTPLLAIGALGTKSAVDFETAFTGVEKTVDGTIEQLEELKQGIKNMAKEIPSSTTEIAAVAEAAGQLGIKTEDILSFTKVMIDLGNATNLSSEEAASALAKFANVTKMSSKDYDKLGATIVALGNNFATTEADIVSMATRLAATGELTGLSESQILALATAMSSVGIEAEAGGSAMSKLLKRIQLAVELGGDDLESFSSVAGMTGESFKQAFEKDAISALSAFIDGLNDTERNGKSAIAILDEMELTEVRLSNTILSLANANEVMSKAVKLGNDSWEENTALTNEASKRYQTLESRFKTTLNKINNLAINLGNKLTPSINKILDKVDSFIEKLDNLSEEEVENIVNIGLMVAAAGPLIKILGTVTNVTSSAVTGIGTFTQAIGVMKTGAESTNEAANKLAKGMSALTSPAGLAAIGITAAISLILIAIENADKEIKEAFSNMGESANDFYNGIQNAEGYLASFNSTVMASSEEQQELQKQMEEIQQGITEICKTASEERRNYTQEEITQLDEYFAKLRELKNREIQIQQQIAVAITQQARTNAEEFQGSLEEYKSQSQEWIATAQQQAEKTIAIIEQSSIEEVALLNQRYGEQANMQNEAYAAEYNKIMEQKQQKIDLANSEVAEILSSYSEGYAERAKQDGDFYEHIEHYNWEQEQEAIRHNAAIENTQNNKLLTTHNKNVAIQQENYRHQEEQKKIWKQMYKDMSDSEAEQLGVWLAMLTQTELYGGEISTENKLMVDSILASYDSMPSKTREAMQNAMTPMLEEMQNAEPTLWAKASSIANGILNRLKKAFDINSPSKETRSIFKNVMQGAELGLEDEEKNIYRQVDSINNNLLNKFRKVTANGVNMGELNNKIVDSTRTIFTTPTVNIYAQDELTPAKMNNIIDTVNKRLGSKY